MKVALVCSAGGHLAQLYALEPWWRLHERFWVTFDKPDARSRLVGERVVHAVGPTNRHLPNLLRNARLAARVLEKERPDVIVSTGAGLALPFFWVGNRLGIRLVYVEVFDRIDKPSLTGGLLAPLCDRVVLKSEAQRHAYPDGVVVGALL